MHLHTTQMPQLPAYGWLKNCEDCDNITSRIMTIRHKKKHKTLYVCIGCRLNLLKCLWDDYTSVVVTDETVGHIHITVAR